LEEKQADGEVTEDAKQSLTALAALSALVGVFCVAQWLIPEDLEIPRWLPFAAFALNLLMLAWMMARRRRERAEEPA
jgi:hypothetical protein